VGSLTRLLFAVATVAGAYLIPAIDQPSAHADPVTTTATVLKVVDGDTVDIVDDVRGRLRIRLLGIDTPETKSPATLCCTPTTPDSVRGFASPRCSITSSAPSSSGSVSAPWC